MSARSVVAVAVSLFLLAVGCSPPNSSPTTPPSSPPQPTARQSHVSMSGAVAVGGAAEAPAGNAEGAELKSNGRNDFGAEFYRLVDQRDEIVSVLKNGLTVIVKRVPSPVVSVRGVTYAGGVYEAKWLGGGLSHLLEHLVAGGSSERRTEAQNRDLLQKIGNNSNADTAEDRTEYFVNTTAPHMAEAVDLVTGWMLGAKITEAEFQREREVVQRELEMGEGEPDRQLFYMARMNRYRISPARVPVIGYQPVIQRLTRDDVYTYYKMAYQPNNMLFVVTGDLDPKDMLQAVQKYVKAAPPGRVFSHDIAAEPPVLTPRTIAATFPKLGQARLMLGFPSVSMNDPDLYALDLLATAMGEGESSLLVEELRDKQQLVSGVAVEDETPSYVKGTFMIMMQADPEKIRSATDAAMKIIEDIKANGIDEERLNRAKTQMRASLVKRRLTSEDISSNLAEDYRMTDDPNFSDKYVERIEKLTPKQVQAAARKYLNPQQLLTTSLFPAEWAGAKGLPRVEDLLRPVSPASSQPAATQPAGQVVRAELDNGTILLLKRISTSPTVVMNLYSLGGVTAEDEKTNGLGNLTMQMLLRGTKSKNAEQLATFFDATGGDMAAICNNNTWSWTASCLAPNFEKTMEVYADVVNNPTFPENELAPMKRRLEAAIQSEDAQWDAQAFRFFRKEFFGPRNSPYQFTARGTVKNIESFTQQQLRDWYEQKVLGSRRVLAIYGDIDVDKAKALAADLLGKGERHASNGNVEHQPPPQQGGPGGNTPSIDVQKVQVQKTEAALAGVVVGFDSNNVIGGPSFYDFNVAKTITGGYTYPTGYIFETLRGLGLVYVAETQNLWGRDKSLPGTFFVFAGCQPENVNRVVDQILINIARVQGSEQDIVPSWFDRARELITVADAMENETPAAQASLAALDELYGLGYRFHDQFQDKIRQVTIPQVQQLARQRLRACIVTISTPRPDLINQKPGLRTYERFPEVDLTPRGVQHDVGGAK